MNQIESAIDRVIRKVAWKMTVRNDSDGNTLVPKKQVKKYRWIIESVDGEIIYDSERDGLERMSEYPIILELLPTVEKEARDVKINSKLARKQTTVVYRINQNLWSIYPTESIQDQCWAT